MTMMVPVLPMPALWGTSGEVKQCLVATLEEVNKHTLTEVADKSLRLGEYTGQQ